MTPEPAGEGAVAPSRRWALRLAAVAPWLLVALPALLQLGLLATAIGGRIGYPYDLEWMEGGMLHHAQRIQDGHGIYVPPSIDFIPYLYTPLYPALVALLGSAFGISYTLGRAISVLALVGTAIVALVQVTGSTHQHVSRLPALAGGVLGLALFAAAYPYMEGWYDLVRADTLYLFMVTAAIAALPRWATTGEGLAGHARVAAAAALLALAFFCKQTGIVYVALGGAIVLVLAWRRVPAFVGIAGLVGLGGTWLLEARTQGWFWIYIREIHAAHDFNMDRFWRSFGNILWHFPAMTVVVAVALVIVLVTRLAKGSVPRCTHPLLLWSATFAVSTLIGAIGWGTEFAHFNAYMPAFLHGGLAAGAAVPAVYACARRWWGLRARAELVATCAALAAALPLAITCYVERWKPAAFVPTARDVAAGDRLITRIAGLDGEVWMPSHPWYVKLAGKAPLVHRMGIKDVTWRQPRRVEDLDAMLKAHAFAALVLDNRDVHLEVPAVKAHYRAAMKLPADERPALYTGAKVRPETVWVPAVPAAPPDGMRVLFDFEHVTWSGWTVSGSAWGGRPANEALPGQGLVLGTSGRRFATSMHGGDAASGRVTSPRFELTGPITLSLGGGTDATKLRVELWVGEQLVATASAPAPGGSTLRPVTLDPGEHRGQPARLVLVDDSPTGHLLVDDVWIAVNPAPTDDTR